MSKREIRGEDNKKYVLKEKKPFYKRWWFILLAVIIVFGALSGGSDEESGSQEAEVSTGGTEEEATEEKNIESKEFGVGEPVTLNGQTIEVTEVEYSKGSDFDKPSEGKEYVIVSIYIENESNEKISYNPFNFTMENSNGQIESQVFTIVDSDTSLSSGELRSGGEVSGTVTFEQPMDDGGLKLIFEPGFWSTDEIIFNLQ